MVGNLFCLKSLLYVCYINRRGRRLQTEKRYGLEPVSSVTGSANCVISFLKVTVQVAIICFITL